MQENDINLKELWQGQKIVKPDLNEFHSKLKKYKKAAILKLIFTNLLLIVTAGIIIFIWYYYQPRLITTKLGIILGISAIAIFLFGYNKILPFFLKTENSLSNKEYIRKLLSLKVKQKFLQGYLLGVYIILLGLGLCLYMYEYTSMLSWYWQTACYALVLMWIAFNWFFIRPQKIRKEQKRLNDLIKTFTSYESQISNRT